MTTPLGHSALASWFQIESAHFASAAAKSRAAAERFRETLGQATERLATYASKVETQQSIVELRPRPPVDVQACLETFAEQGPEGLNARERRALLSHPDRVPAGVAEKIVEAYPALMRHVVRACLSAWFQTRGQAWGRDYVDLMARRARGSGVALLERGPIPARRSLSVGSSPGDALLGATLSTASAIEAYDYLRNELGLRDSWQYTGQVLAAWLEQQASQRRPLADVVQEIRGHERLRALLLPQSKSNSQVPAGVRAETVTHAAVVGTLLRATYMKTPLLGGVRAVELADLLLTSQFGDPRLPPLGDGWKLVSQLYDDAFRSFLSSLSEQDLEVFFAHAMNEPDRRKFWMQYLGAIERTGCVLDRESQERLSDKLKASPEMQGAISRAYRFRLASGVQAFFLVFANLVVVEFSDTGNAAYVYERDYFESKLEKAIRNGRVETSLDLKLKEKCVHRITHQRGWGGKAAEWLAQQGIHRRQKPPPLPR